MLVYAEKAKVQLAQFDHNFVRFHSKLEHSGFLAICHSHNYVTDIDIYETLMFFLNVVDQLSHQCSV